jgi:hypothetical protein
MIRSPLATPYEPQPISVFRQLFNSQFPIFSPLPPTPYFPHPVFIPDGQFKLIYQGKLTTREGIIWVLFPAVALCSRLHAPRVFLYNRQLILSKGDYIASLHKDLHEGEGVWYK